MMTDAMKNPRTTIAALGILLSVAGGAVQALTDNDPMTNPDWAAITAAVAGAVGLLFARDSNKTSEQVGAK